MRYMIVLLALTLTTAAEAEQRQRAQARHRRRATRKRPARRRCRATFLRACCCPPARIVFRLTCGDRFSQAGGVLDFTSRGGPIPARGIRTYGGSAGGSYFGYSDYYAQEYPGQAAPPPEPEAASRITGMLRLEITPATGLQYYVDGLYIGSSSELGTQFEVNAGARRIEIRAPGYKPVIFDARFVPGETVTRRGALEPLEDVATLPRATGSKTMYVIPGCFIGNARPEPSALPKGCDIGRLTTRGGS